MQQPKRSLTQLSLLAPAKVNLALHVTGKREDGFHDIDSVMVKLELADVLHVSASAEGISLEVIGADLPIDSSNLAYKAAELYFVELAKIEAFKDNKIKGASILLEKHIPIAAGLGGGSSDAAAVLVALDEIVACDDIDLMALALELGSDVPFFIVEDASARARGRGEALEPINVEPLHILLANPNLAVSAKEAYEAIENFAPALDAGNYFEKLAIGKAQGLNSLEAGVVKKYPVIKSVLDALSAEGFSQVMMSGSGSTCFAISEDGTKIQEAVERLKVSHPEWSFWVTSTLG